MAGRLKDKVAIVTGAGSILPGWGNGKATAVLFAREGAHVVLVDNRAEAVEETAAIIRKEGGSCEAAVCDVTSSEQRSEEHTSELQSLMRISYAVFCLKKKNKRM